MDRTAAAFAPWRTGEAAQHGLEWQFLLGADRRPVSRAGLKVQLREVERRIAGSISPWTDDLLQLASLGACVVEAGPRGGRWLQRSRAESMVVQLERMLHGATEPRIEDFIKLVLAAAAAARGQPHSPRAVVAARYEACIDEVDNAAAPSVGQLVALARSGAAWAQGQPQQSRFQLGEQLADLRLRVLALRSPQADEFIRLAVLEVALQAVQHKENHPLA